MSGNEFGAFLRARRDRLRPTEVDLPTAGRRRVPGLRREEVAILAGVSVDYYSKLEQGHVAGASAEILDAVADALRLDPTERAHLHRLARPVAPHRRTRTSSSVTARPGLRRLLDLMADVPAVIVGPSFSQLAWNHLADALFGLSALERAGRTFPQHLFLDPAARTLYPDWPDVATEAVDYIRFSAGLDPDDPEIRAVVGELSVKSPEFRTLWNRQTVRDKTFGRKRLQHGLVGPLELSFETFSLPGESRRALITYTTEPGSPSEERLRLLASWTAEQATGPGAHAEPETSTD
ncbi:helix-turn-helix transcriptional regulator [Amycolatopsis endophytica]|uniref:Transcriptional regulator with XRE-family HTH domain n=1 Tax=Amycolatopsis endophytica TaxID=860233 RepID=A0A853B1K0_9PSEU|nr:helix-turn-helix transcriptional regulator [Amycolatopsis endophytica]NYI88829.1 transcriptional regulator with XRE-family HTH domain [Amycolatopsis endophytica]